jgi:hypothetical protein
LLSVDVTCDHFIKIAGLSVQSVEGHLLKTLGAWKAVDLIQRDLPAIVEFRRGRPVGFPNETDAGLGGKIKAGPGRKVETVIEQHAFFNEGLDVLETLDDLFRVEHHLIETQLPEEIPQLHVRLVAQVSGGFLNR